MKKNNFARHFGEHYKAELTCMEKIEFTNKEQVIELLRQLNLLKKVLVPTKSMVVGLLTDATVSANDKKKLESFMTKTQEEELKIEKTE